MLSILFSSCISHGFLPEDFMKTILVPIIKDKTGDMCDINNYRPIAISTAISKIFENILLIKTKEFIQTTDNQFGFKTGLSTDMCVYSLKEIIDLYHDQSSPVFVLFLDASKAFDKVEHCKLFKKLINRGTPLCIVRLLMFWYSNQLICVRWLNKTSCYFKVTNGVKQGGILSSHLFNVYMDDLSVELSNTTAGCNLNNTCLNHLIYADDLTLLAPSVSGLQKLLDICVNYAIEHNITFNTKKSVAMYIKPKNIYLSNIPKVYMDGNCVEYKHKHKYLGVIVSSDRSCDFDIKRQTRNLFVTSNMLLRKFSLCDPNIKIKLFKTFCINFYCSHLWSLYKKETMYKLKVSFNNAFRKLLCYERRCSASNMFLECDVNSFDCIRRKYIFSFKTRLSDSDNIILNHLYSYSIFYSNHMSEWYKKLYLNKNING